MFLLYNNYMIIMQDAPAVVLARITSNDGPYAWMIFINDRMLGSVCYAVIYMVRVGLGLL